MAAAACLLAVGAVELGSATAAAAASKEHTIVIEAVAFAPNPLTVAKGDTVVWVNKDPFPHNAVAQHRSAFASPELATGKSWKFTAKEAGTFPYICTLHPSMKGMLVVK